MAASFEIEPSRYFVKTQTLVSCRMTKEGNRTMLIAQNSKRPVTYELNVRTGELMYKRMGEAHRIKTNGSVDAVRLLTEVLNGVIGVGLVLMYFDQFMPGITEEAKKADEMSGSNKRAFSVFTRK